MGRKTVVIKVKENIITVQNLFKMRDCTGKLCNGKGNSRPKNSTADDRRILTIVKKNPQTSVQQMRDILPKAGVSVRDDYQQKTS